MIVLGIGDFGVTSDPGESIKTFGLGSCVAVICADPVNNIAGMVHVALPDSSASPDRVKLLPGYFADTGIPELFNNLRKVGWRENAGRPWVKLVGGAAIMDPNNTFNIGKRNALAIKKILWGMGLGPVAEDLGGTLSRTVTVSARDGTVMVSSPGLPVKTL